MASIDKSSLGEFTVGEFINDSSDILIFGTMRGYVFYVDLSEGLKSKTPNLIGNTKIKFKLNLKNEIRAIERLQDNQLLIGSRNGGIYIFDYNTGLINEISKRLSNGLWRILVLNENEFLTSGKYGDLKRWYIEGDFWKFENLPGHSDSIFCLDFLNKQTKTFITDDFRGIDYIWNLPSKLLNNNSTGNLQHISPLDENTYAAIDYTGDILIFDKDDIKHVYKIRKIFKMASGQGYDVKKIGNKIICGTRTRCFIIDIDSHEIQEIKRSCKNLLSHKGNYIGIARSSVFLVNLDEAERRENQEIFSYLKIGLVGHTGTGKSSLCNYLLYDEIGDEDSTFGRKVWNLQRIRNNALEEDKQILLYDVGGQETQLFTLYPQIADSHVIFILFKQTAVDTLKVALATIKDLKKYTSSDCKYYLIQTWIDNEHNECEAYTDSKLIEEYGIQDILKVSLKTGEGIDEIWSIIEDEFTSTQLTEVVQSIEFQRIQNLIELRRNSKLPWMSVENLKDEYNGQYKKEILNRHLTFILKNLDSRGVIDFLSEVGLIILHDRLFNKLKSVLPEFIGSQNGMIKKFDLIDMVKNSDSVKSILSKSPHTERKDLFPIFCEKIIREMIDNNFAIIYENYNDLIIVPRHFRENFPSFPRKYESIFPEKNEDSKILTLDQKSFSEMNLTLFLLKLKGMRYFPLILSKSEMIFSYKMKLFYLYVTFSTKGPRTRNYELTLQFGRGESPENVFRHIKHQTILELSEFFQKNDTDEEDDYEYNGSEEEVDDSGDDNLENDSRVSFENKIQKKKDLIPEDSDEDGDSTVLDEPDGDPTETNEDSDERDGDSIETNEDSDERDGDSTETNEDLDERDGDSTEADEDSDELPLFIEDSSQINYTNLDEMTCFISYAYDDKKEENNQFVVKVAEDLFIVGNIKCVLDRWELIGGKSNSRFMKKCLETDKVIVICDKKLISKLKSDKEYWIQFETFLIEQRLGKNPSLDEDIIPVLRQGDKEDSIPLVLGDKTYVDFRVPENYDENLDKLIKSLRAIPYLKPPF
jgi:GTPase SAR1 family protein